MLKIAVILGSTRPGRIGEGVAKWVHEIAAKRADAQFELVDLAHYHLPLLDESLPAGYGQYEKEHTRIWARKVGEFDGYVFVTGEYNHAVPGALKNALDFVGPEWNNKAAGLVSYGSAGGARAAEQLRLILGELQIADVRAQVMFSLFTDFEDFTAFKPDPRHVEEVEAMLDQLVAWAGALKGLRT